MLGTMICLCLLLPAMLIFPNAGSCHQEACCDGEEKEHYSPKAAGSSTGPAANGPAAASGFAEGIHICCVYAAIMGSKADTLYSGGVSMWELAGPVCDQHLHGLVRYIP